MKVIAKVYAIAVDALREIFDESAYARYLTYHQVESSRTSYADFLREQETMKARRPKCC
jgi:hypothetical protein